MTAACTMSVVADLTRAVNADMTVFMAKRKGKSVEAERPRITIDKPSAFAEDLWRAAKIVADQEGMAASEWVFKAIHEKLLASNPQFIPEIIREKLQPKPKK